NTSCRVAIQTLGGIRDLHEIYYLHRDIKPANFAVGLKDDEKDSIVYILDFGMARFFRHKNRQIVPRRDHVRFRGTARYASIASLNDMDSCRKDDIESWFYMVLEFFAGFAVPWNKCKSKKEFFAIKRSFRNKYHEYLQDCTVSKDLLKIMRYIDNMNFYSIPDYNGIRDILIGIIDRMGFRDTEPLDWSPRRHYQ
ncbi:hypothetical protein PENTCL1PPCAC_24023, partial [Pristionchus entomophagus]